MKEFSSQKNVKRLLSEPPRTIEKGRESRGNGGDPNTTSDILINTRYTSTRQ